MPNEETPGYKLQDLILKVRDSHYDPLLGQSAIPALKEAFANTSDRLTKENVANVLIMLGQKDDAYWSVLSKRAQEIVIVRLPTRWYSTKTEKAFAAQYLRSSCGG